MLLFFIYRISLTNFVTTSVYTPIHLEITFFVFFFNGKVMGQCVQTSGADRRYDHATDSYLYNDICLGSC